MKRLPALIFALVTLSFFPLHSDERIGGTLENVDLLIVDLYNDDGHNYGEKYYAINRDKTSMRVSIKLMDSENIEDHLIDYAVIVDPHRRIDLGYVIQKDLAKGASWRYEWKANREKER